MFNTQEIKAIDVVLIPPKQIYDLSLELSNDLNKGIKPVIKLDETHLPHITLVQLYIRDNKMIELIGNIDQVVGMIRPLNLKIIGLEKENSTVLINIHLSTELNGLYVKMMKLTENFETKSTKDGFILDDDETIWSGALNWVTNYRNKYKFNPHITLAKDPVVSIPKIDKHEFITDRLMICQLGNYCTCRKIIKEWKLNNK